MLDTSVALSGIIVTVLVAVGTFDWYLSLANDKIKDALLGRAVLLEGELRERVTALHGRFRDRMFFLSEGRSEVYSAEEIQKWEQFELEQWKKILNSEWDAISSRFRRLFEARHVTKTSCFVAGLLAHLNIVLVLISSTVFLMSAFVAGWRARLIAWLLGACVALIISTCIVGYYIMVGRFRERRLEGVAPGDD